MKFSRSDALFERSLKTLAGGVSSSARTLEAGNEPHPIFMQIGRGAEMTDVDGNQYVDYLLSFGSLILGHSDPDVQAAVVEQVSRGAVFGTAFELEGRLAELLVDVIPCAEQVRFANTGSDAIAAAIRLARTYTGKDKILKFEGHYHGSLDVIIIESDLRVATFVVTTPHFTTRRSPCLHFTAASICMQETASSV